MAHQSLLAFDGHDSLASINSFDLDNDLILDTSPISKSESPLRGNHKKTIKDIQVSDKSSHASDTAIKKQSTHETTKSKVSKRSPTKRKSEKKNNNSNLSSGHHRLLRSKSEPPLTIDISQSAHGKLETKKEVDGELRREKFLGTVTEKKRSRSVSQKRHSRARELSVAAQKKRHGSESDANDKRESDRNAVGSRRRLRERHMHKDNDDECEKTATNMRTRSRSRSVSRRNRSNSSNLKSESHRSSSQSSRKSRKPLSRSLSMDENIVLRARKNSSSISLPGKLDADKKEAKELQADSVSESGLESAGGSLHSSFRPRLERKPGHKSLNTVINNDAQDNSSEEQSISGKSRTLKMDAAFILEKKNSTSESIDSGNNEEKKRTRKSRRNSKLGNNSPSTKEKKLSPKSSSHKKRDNTSMLKKLKAEIASKNNDNDEEKKDCREELSKLKKSKKKGAAGDCEKKKKLRRKSLDNHMAACSSLFNNNSDPTAESDCERSVATTSTSGSSRNPRRLKCRSQKTIRDMELRRGVQNRGNGQDMLSAYILGCDVSSAKEEEEERSTRQVQVEPHDDDKEDESEQTRSSNNHKSAEEHKLDDLMRRSKAITADVKLARELEAQAEAENENMFLACDEDSGNYIKNSSLVQQRRTTPFRSFSTSLVYRGRRSKLGAQMAY